MINRNESLIPTFTYHLYNKAVGNEMLFADDNDYLYFLGRIKEMIVPFVDILAYCLLPDHFHILARVKSESDIQGNYLKHCKEKNISPGSSKRSTEIIREALRSLFSRYAKHFNQKYGRKGKLFEFSYQRKLIEENTTSRELVLYTHVNPISHGFVNDYLEWKYSSFHVFQSKKDTEVNRGIVMDWFSGISDFIEQHKFFNPGQMDTRYLFEDTCFSVQGEFPTQSRISVFTDLSDT